MSWHIRQCGENLYHHIYAWGNDRHPIFKHQSHFHKYFGLLDNYAQTHDIGVIAYALMEWHVHLFIHDKYNNLSKFMMDLHGTYAQFYNRITHRVGHVFGKRFNNKIVRCTIYGKWLTRYIHRQPLEAGLVSKAHDYPWSSYRVYLGQEENRFVQPDIILDQFGTERDRSINYQGFVETSIDGPVDWNARYFRLRSISELIASICAELDIESALVKKPRGRPAQILRSKVITILMEKYDVKASAIAKAFGLSRSAVTRILQRSTHQYVQH